MSGGTVRACGPYAKGSRGRLMIELALRTSIPAREWEACSDADIATALTVLHEWDARRG